MKEHEVFISHSSKDRIIANALCSYLEENNVQCWIAPRDIAPGIEWSEAIVTNISKSHFFVILISKESNKSDQVKRELQIAFEDDINVIPVKVDDSSIPNSLRYYLTSLHYLDISKNNISEYGHVILEIILGDVHYNTDENVKTYKKIKNTKLSFKQYILLIIILFSLFFYIIFSFI